MTKVNAKTTSKSASISKKKPGGASSEKAKKESAGKVSKVKSDSPTQKKTTTKTNAKDSSATRAKSSAGKSDKSASGLVDRQIAAQMMEALCKRYPDADCELTYKNDYELLTSVILSAQTTDVNVNKATPGLFKKFPTPTSLAEGDIEEIKSLIKSTGYYNNKAKSIQTCAQAILSKFGGRVPATLEELVTLPGVGRKTANVVLGVIHKVPGWTVDTHVQRLSQRLGFTKNTDPYKIELDLQKLFPEQDWTKYSITLIWHGRRLCYARNPDCADCPINNICPSSLTP